MTAKERLRELVDGLPEGEAERLLALYGAGIQRDRSRGSDDEVLDEVSHGPIFRSREQQRQGIALIETWLADNSGLDEQVYPQLKAALDDERGIQLHEANDWHG